MKFKILPLLLIFTLLLGAAVSAEPKFHYSFDEAFDMALKSSSEYKSKDNAISKAYDNFEKLEKAAPREVKLNISNFKKFITDQVDPYVAVEKAYSSYQQAILDRDSTKITLALNLRSAIIAVQNAEMESEKANTDENTWEEELKLLTLRLEQSLISKTEYKSKKADLENKIEGLAKTQDALETAYYNLNSLLGREDEKDIIVNLDDTVIPLGKLNLEQIKKDRIKKDTGLNQKKNQRYAEKVYFDLVEERYLKYDLDRFTDSMRSDMIEMYEEAKESFEAADLNYEKALTAFNKDFDEMIKSIIDNIEEIDSIKEEMLEEQENAEFYKIKYEARMISKSEYTNKLNNITALQNKQKAAQLALNLKYAKLLAYSD
ncbi:MAG: hypothetical protein PHC44_03140 [Lutispora sp.]|nr:hypothetical protein [Lutispora sp.]